jgi:hypothetical protein
MVGSIAESSDGNFSDRVFNVDITVVNSFPGCIDNLLAKTWVKKSQ